jgi:putative flippase GtrA
MTSAISESIAFLRKNDLKTILARIRSRDVPPLIQFALYGMCGGLATVTFIGTVVYLSMTLVPAYEGRKVAAQALLHARGFSILWPAPEANDSSAIEITNQIRSLNLLFNNCIAFLLANVVAYVSNILIVFKTGRHHPVMEFLYFTLVSGVAFGISQVAGPWLVNQFGVSTNVAILTNLVASMLLNFAGRKFFVFQG